MKRLLVPALLLILVLPIALAMSGWLDLGFTKPWLERFTSRALERDFRVTGDLSLRLGRTPRLAADGIELANPDWAEGQFAQIQRLEIVLDLFSLWRGPIVVERLRIENAEISFLTEADGRNNWSLGTGAEDSGSAGQDAATPIIVVDGEINNALLRFDNPNLTQPTELRLEQALAGVDAAEDLLLTITGSAGDLPLTLQSRAGPYANLLRGRDVHLQSQLALGAYQLEVQGRVGNVHTREDLHASAQLRGPDSANLYRALNIKNPDSGAVDITAQLSSLSPGLQWSVVGQFGSVQADITGAVSDPATLAGLQSSFALSGSNLQLIAISLGLYTLPDDAFELSGALQHSGETLEISDVKLKVGEAVMTLDAEMPAFPSSRDLAATARINGPSLARFRELLGLHGVIDVPFSLEAELLRQEQGLEILESQLKVGDIHLNLRGPLGEYPGLAGSRIQFELEGQDLSQLLAELDIQGGPAIPYHGNGTLMSPAANTMALADTVLKFAGMRVSAEGHIDDMAALEQAEFSIRAEADSLKTSMRALGQSGFPDQPASLEARIAGSLSAPVIDGIAVNVGDITLQMQGSLQNFPSLAGSRATLQGEAPASVTWLPAQIELPVRFGANLTSADEQLWLDDLSVESPDWHLSGTVRLTQFNPPLADMKLQVRGPRLAGLLPSIERFSFAATPFELEADITSAASELTINTLRLEGERNRFVAKGGLSITGDGAVSLLAEGESLATLGTLQGGLLPARAYRAAAQLRRQGALWSLEDVSLQLADDELTGSASYRQGKRPRYELRLQSQRFNMGQFVDRVEAKSGSDVATGDASSNASPNASDSASGQPSSAGDERFIPDNPLELSWMSEFDASVDLDLDGLGIRDNNFEELTSLNTLRLVASLDNGHLQAPTFNIAGDRGELSMPMSLHWQNGVLAAELAPTSESLRLSLLSKSYDAEGIPVQRLRSRFAATGATPHQLASTLSGYLLMESGPGRTANSSVDRLFNSFITEVLETINPFFEKDPYTQLECGVIGVEFDDGTALLRPGFIFRTSKLEMMATGNIDLRTEALELDVATKARKGLGISVASLVTPFLEVGGTMSRPKIGIDTTGAALTGGAAAATGGLSILASSLWNRYVDKSNPCEEASEKAQARLDEAALAAQTP